MSEIASEERQQVDRPRLLDLFCGAGGCAVGYHRAGFDVVGVDIKPQKRYPFEFHQADALEFAAEHGHEFDAIHASPPCQGYSRMRHLPWLRGREYPLLVEPCRELLESLGLPWIIENVEDAPLGGAVLCGMMFGLKVYRHRRFESSRLLLYPPHLKHREIIGRGRNLNDRTNASSNGWVSLPSKGRKLFCGRTDGERGPVNHNYHGDGIITIGGHNFKASAARAAMQIDWMTRNELAQAIPPAYTEYLGRQLIRSCRRMMIEETRCAGE
jgi:DNA (cytosine-5)-methyltransferase 1